jgi:hypothetical protein
MPGIQEATPPENDLAFLTAARIPDPRTPVCRKPLRETSNRFFITLPEKECNATFIALRVKKVQSPLALSDKMLKKTRTPTFFYEKPRMSGIFEQQRWVSRIPRNYRGAVYGWDQTMDNSGPGRMAPKIPIKNLYLAGAWTSPGGGYGAVIPSGLAFFAEVMKMR